MLLKFDEIVVTSKDLELKNTQMTLLMQKIINLKILDKERHEDGIGMG